MAACGATMFDAHEISFAWNGDAGPLLDRVSLSLPAGGIVGLLGPSGAGKTTLARILAGYLAPVSGDVRLDGEPIPPHGASPVQLVLQHAETAVDPRWKIRRIMTQAWYPDAATLADFGIRRDWLDRFAHELSGGELHRIALVRALHPGLRVLIVDELTAMHDAIGQARLWHALLKLQRAKKFALLAVSHDRALLRAIGADCIELQDGDIRRI
jgi:peptide/nickel transport system ATP-binding protein